MAFSPIVGSTAEYDGVVGSSVYEVTILHSVRKETVDPMPKVCRSKVWVVKFASGDMKKAAHMYGFLQLLDM